MDYINDKEQTLLQRAAQLRSDGWFITGGSDGDSCHIGHDDDSSMDFDCGTFDREEANQQLVIHVQTLRQIRS